MAYPYESYNDAINNSELLREFDYEYQMGNVTEDQRDYFQALVYDAWLNKDYPGDRYDLREFTEAEMEEYGWEFNWDQWKAEMGYN